jgi:hypothetical protein
MLRNSYRFGVMAIIAAVPLFVAPAVSAESLGNAFAGTWKASQIGQRGFSQMTIRLAAGSRVNASAGAVRFAWAGGRTTCRARLTYLGGDAHRAEFAVRFQAGAARRARYFCRAGAQGVRLRLSTASDPTLRQGNIGLPGGRLDFNAFRS